MNAMACVSSFGCESCPLPTAGSSLDRSDSLVYWTFSMVHNAMLQAAYSQADLGGRLPLLSALRAALEASCKML